MLSVIELLENVQILYNSKIKVVKQLLKCLFSAQIRPVIIETKKQDNKKMSKSQHGSFNLQPQTHMQNINIMIYHVMTRVLYFLGVHNVLRGTKEKKSPKISDFRYKLDSNLKKPLTPICWIQNETAIWYQNTCMTLKNESCSLS